MQNANKAVRDAPKLLKARSAVLNLYVQQAGFSSMATDLIFLWRPPHKRKTRWLSCKPPSSLCRSMSFLWFACKTWPSTDRGAIRTSHICSTKRNISSERSGGISTKYCTIELSRYTVLSSSCISFDDRLWSGGVLKHTLMQKSLETHHRQYNRLITIILDGSLLSFYIVQTQNNVRSQFLVCWTM